MNSIKYFNRVDLPNWTIIADQIREYVYSKTDLAVTRKSFLNALDLDDLKKEVPMLFTSMSEIDLPEVEYVGLTVVFAEPGLEHTTPHSDDIPRCVRLNIPILNCKDTYTVFYKPLKPPKFGQQPNGIVYSRYYLDECEEVARLELTEPNMVMVNVPHMVERAVKIDPRLVVTIGFMNDPWNFLQS